MQLMGQLLMQFNNNALRDEFLGLFEAIINLYSADFEFDILDDSEMAFRLFVACGGLTGYLFNIIYFAATNAVFEGRNVVSLNDFAASYTKSVSEEDRHDSNPFEPNFKSTNYAYLDASKKVGRRADTYTPNQSRYKPKSLNEAIMAGE